MKLSRRKKLLLGASVWVSVLLGLEGAVRVREKILYGTFSRAGSTIYDEKSPTGALKPNVVVEGTSFTLHTSSLAFRGREVARPKPAGVYRIVCVGGSTTFDVNARNDDETWPARLEAKLRVRHPGVEVVNAGTPGQSLRQTLTDEHWSKVESLEPDLVVCYHATNDISHLTHAAWKAQPKPALSDPASQVARSVTDRSLFAYKVWLLLGSLTRPKEVKEPPGASALPEAGVLAFEADLRELVRRASARGAKVALATFALRWSADQPGEVQRELSAGAANEYPGLSLEGINRGFARYNEAIERVARETHSIVIPVAAELSGHPEWFGDIMHHSPPGSERMAVVVGEALEQSGAFPQ